MTSEKEFKDLEFMVNFRATTILDADQYPTLVQCMSEWCEEHPEQVDKIRVLKSIEFRRSS